MKKSGKNKKIPQKQVSKQRTRKKQQTSERNKTGQKIKSNSNSKSSVKKAVPSKYNVYIYLVITALSFLLYSNSIKYGYTFDDKIVVTKNKFVQRGFGGVKDILTNDFFTSYFGEKQNLVSGGRYRPLPVITFAIEWELFAGANNPKTIDPEDEEAFSQAPANKKETKEEGNPHISHIINILLYALTGIVIYNLLNHLLGRYKYKKWFLSIPFITTIIFITHPIHTEVVANIKGRDEIMVLLGSLVSLWLTLKYLDTNKKYFLLLSFITFFAALLSKENTITFVAVIPLTVYFFTSHTLRRNLISVVPLVLSSVIFIIIRGIILGGNTTEPLPELMNNPFLFATPGEHYASVFYTLGEYIRLLIFPHPLTFDYYPFHIPLIAWSDIRAIVPLVFYIVIGIIAIIGFKKKTIISYSIAYYLCTLSIVSNIFFPIGAFMNERFIFVSSLSFCLVVAYFLSYTLSQQVKKTNLYIGIVSAITVGIIAVYTIKVIPRDTVWESDYSLFTTDVKTSHASAYGNLVAGKQFYFKAKKMEKGEKKEAYFNKAIKHLTKAVTIHEKYINGLYFLAEAHYQYNKNYKKTIEYLERLIQLTPDNAEVNYRLGAMFGKHVKNMEKSVYYLERTMKIEPTHKAAHNNLGAIYYNLGQYKNALRIYESLNKLTPNDSKVLQPLGMVYKNLGNYQKAAEIFDILNKLMPNNPQILGFLSELYQLSGDRQKAQQYARLAKQSTRKAGNK